MTFRHPTLLALCLVTATAGAITAQNDSAAMRKRATDAAADNAADYLPLDAVLGADVRLAPTDAQRREAATDGEKAEGATGSVTDVLIARDGGSLEWAVLSIGGLLGIGDKTVVVPCRALRWHAADECFALDVSKQQLEALPEFDLDEARESGLADSVKLAHETWKTLRKSAAHDGESDRGAAKAGGREMDMDRAAADASAARSRDGEQARTAQIDGKTYVPARDRLLCASDVASWDVYARQQEFGSVSKALVDCAQHRVGFVVIGHGGVAGIGKTEYLVPFDALHLRARTDDDSARVWLVDRSAAELERAPKYEKPSDGHVDPAALRAAREMRKDSDRSSSDN